MVRATLHGLAAGPWLIADGPFCGAPSGCALRTVNWAGRGARMLAVAPVLGERWRRKMRSTIKAAVAGCSLAVGAAAMAQSAQPLQQHIDRLQVK
jgi:hypothetical protein